MDEANQYPNEFPDDDSQGEDSQESSQEEEENSDHTIWAEFVRVNRTRVRFKCEFRNAFIFINGREYVAKTLAGDFEY